MTSSSPVLARASLLAAFAVLSAVQVRAADVSWDGGGGVDRNWDTGANWTGPTDNTKPSTTDQARVINNTDATSAQLTTPQTVQQLRVGLGGSAGSLDVSNDLTVTDTSESNSTHIGDGATGKLTQTGGTFITGGGFIVGLGGTGNGTYNISGGSLTANYMFLGRGGTGAVGTVNQTGGAVTLNDGGDALRIGAVGGGTGTYNISSGSVTAARMVIGAEGDATTNGVMNVSGSAIVTTNSALKLGADGSGLLVLNGSRTGTGTNVTITGDRFTWTKDAPSDPLAPPSPSGTLRALIDTAAIGTPSLMRAVNTQAITINPGSLLDVGFTPGTTPTSGTWTVLTWAGSDPSANVAFAPGVAAGWSFNLDTAANALTVTYASVPEPATFGVAAMVVGSLLLRRRKTGV